MNAPKTYILVIDDEPKITRQIRLNLELNGEYQVREENVATHALAAAEEFPPHLILLDVMMPELDGGELASQFRARTRFRDIPIVFLTAAVTADEVRRHGGYIGGERFLAKPVDPKELDDCLREQLAKHASPPPLPRTEAEQGPHLAY